MAQENLLEITAVQEYLVKCGNIFNGLTEEQAKKRVKEAARDSKKKTKKSLVPASLQLN